MDLKHGVFIMNGFDITTKTSPEEVLRHFPDCRYRDTGKLIFASWRKEPVNVDGTDFLVKIGFESKRLSYIKLQPVLRKDEVPDSDELLQEKRRQISDEWLRRKLGTPDKHTAYITQYIYDWGRIYTASSFDGPSPYDGGMIEMFFNRL